MAVGTALGTIDGDCDGEGERAEEFGGAVAIDGDSTLSSSGQLLCRSPGEHPAVRKMLWLAVANAA